MDAAVISPLVGHLGDIFGRRNFHLGNIIVIIQCGVAAPANDINTVISASVLIGVGCSLHQPAGSFFGEIVPKYSLESTFGLVISRGRLMF
jgi:MFS family permease